jgi:hypothetical protein
MTPAELEASIRRETDPKKLRQWIKNLDGAGQTLAANTARRHMYSVSAKAEDGTLEHDVWQSIHSLEDALSTERKRTVRLARTRQKITRVGEKQTVADLVNASAPSSGFQLLVERRMIDLLFESVVLRHQSDFDEPTRHAAKSRLDNLDAEFQT